jgi:hypothetical protein
VADLGRVALRWTGEWELDTGQLLRHAIAVSAIPAAYNDLWRHSVYCQLLEVNEANHADLLYDASYNKLLGTPTVEQDFDGNLAYYAMQPGGSFVRSTDGRGEFLCISVQMEDPATGSAYTGQRYVHYSQVFQPTAAALEKMDLTMVVLGVVYQNSAYLMATMNNMLDAMDDLNAKMVTLSQLFAEFTSRQAAIQDNEGACKVPYSLLEKLIAAGVTPPQRMLTTGIIPALYVRAWTYNSLEDRYIVVFDAFYLQEKNGKLEPQYIQDKWLKDHNNNKYSSLADHSYADEMPDRMGLDWDDYQEFSELLRSNNYSWGEGADMAAIIGAIPLFTREEDVSKYFCGANYECTIKTPTKTGVNDGYAPAYEHISGVDTHTFAGVLYYLDGIWTEQITANSAYSDDREDGFYIIIKTTLTPKYTPVTESIDDVIAAKKAFFADSSQLQSWADVVRVAYDNTNTLLGSYSNMLSMTNNDLQIGFSTADSIMAKLEGTKRRSTRNIR